MTGVPEKRRNVTKAANREIRLNDVVAIEVKIVDIVIRVDNEAGPQRSKRWTPMVKLRDVEE